MTRRRHDTPPPNSRLEARRAAQQRQGERHAETRSEALPAESRTVTAETRVPPPDGRAVIVVQ